MPSGISATILESGTSIGFDFAANLLAVSGGSLQDVSEAGYGGTYTLKLGSGGSTITMPCVTTPDNAAALINAVLGAGAVSVTGFGNLAVTFAATATQPALIANGSGLTAGYPSVSSTAGTTPGNYFNVTSYYPSSGYWTAATGVSNKFLTQGGVGGGYAVYQITGLTSAGTYAVAAYMYDASTQSAHFPGLVPALQQTWYLFDGSTLAGATLRATNTTTVRGPTNGSMLPMVSGYCGSGTLWLVLSDVATVNPSTGGTGIYVPNGCYCAPFGTNAWGTDVPLPTATAGPSVSVNVVSYGGPPTITNATQSYTESLGNLIYQPPNGDPWIGAQPYAWYALTTQVNPGDACTVTTQVNSFTTTAGAVGAATNMPVTNSAGTPTLPQSPACNLKLAMGLTYGSAGGEAPCYANIAKGADAWLPSVTDASHPLTYDSDGYVSNLATFQGFHAGAYLISTVLENDTYTYAPKGYPLESAGNYTLFYDAPGATGGSGATLNFWGGFSPSSQNITAYTDHTSGGTVVNATDNRVDITVTTPAGFLCPILKLFLTSGYVTNVRVYPPEVTSLPGFSAATAPKWHPAYLAALKGTAGIRTMYLGRCMDGAVNMGDWLPVTAYSAYNTSVTATRYTITAISPYAYGSGNPFTLGPQPPAAGGYTYFKLKMTFAGGHGFTTGNRITIDSNVTLTLQANAGDPSPNPPTSTYLLTGQLGDVFVIDANNIAVGSQTNLTNFVGQTGLSVTAYQNKIALHPYECVDLANTLGCTLHYCIPQGMPNSTDATPSYTQVAAYMAANLVKNLELEMSNEPWNTSYGYPYQYFATRAIWITTSAASNRNYPNAKTNGAAASFTNQMLPMQALALDSGFLYDQFAAAWAAAGRTDLRLLLSGGISATSDAQGQGDYKNAHDSAGRQSGDSGFTGAMPFHGIVTAPYQELYPNSAALGGNTTYSSTDIPHATFDALTLEQLMDYGDLFFANLSTLNAAANYDASRGHLALLQSYFTGDVTSRQVAYEAGPSYMGLGELCTGLDTTKGSNRSMAASLHPRFVPWMYAYWNWLRSSGGYSLVYLQSLNQQWSTENGLARVYGIIHGASQLAGRGDGSDGQSDNMPAIQSGGVAITPAFDAATGGNGIACSPYLYAVLKWIKGNRPPGRFYPHIGRLVHHQRQRRRR